MTGSAARFLPARDDDLHKTPRLEASQGGSGAPGERLRAGSRFIKRLPGVSRLRNRSAVAFEYAMGEIDRLLYF